MTSPAVLDPYRGLDPGDEAWLRAKTEKIHHRFRQTALDLIQTGQDLIEIRDRFPHGTWEYWFRASAFAFSLSSAKRFIQMAQQFGNQIAQLGRFEGSSLYVFCQPNVPPEARTLAIKWATEDELTINADQARRAIKEVAKQNLPVPAPKSPPAEPEPTSAPDAPSVDIDGLLRLLLPSGGMRTVRLDVEVREDADGDLIVSAARHGGTRESGRSLGEVLTALTARLSVKQAPVNSEDHIDWAQRIGAAIAVHLGHKPTSQEWEELRQEAVYEMIRKTHDFDLAWVQDGDSLTDRFRGYADKFVRGHVQRQAERLGNAGTYATRRRGQQVVRVEKYDEGERDDG